MQVPNNQSPLNCHRKQTPLSLNGSDCDKPVSGSESDGGVVKDEEHCSSSANQINEEMQRMLNQLWVVWLWDAISVMSVSFSPALWLITFRCAYVCFCFKAWMWVWGWLWQSGLGGNWGDAASLGRLPRMHFTSWPHPPTRRGRLQSHVSLQWDLWVLVLNHQCVDLMSLEVVWDNGSCCLHYNLMF